ncbi:hypothetical protein [Kitasatospora sp. NPDC004531]
MNDTPSGIDRAAPVVGGAVLGITAIHRWTLAPAAGATLCATEQSWDGAPVRDDPVGVGKTLDRSLRQWLRHLKTAAERATC